MSPGLIDSIELFDCVKRALKLTRIGCARLSESVGRDRPDPWEGRHACLFCSTGARNRAKLLGGPVVAERPAFAAAEPWRTTCARCRRKSDRLIREKLCVSCMNREYEVKRGRNAKGSRPMLTDHLHPHTVIMTEGGRVRRVQQDLATGADEVMIGAIKHAAGPVAFGWGNARG